MNLYQELANSDFSNYELFLLNFVVGNNLAHLCNNFNIKFQLIADIFAQFLSTIAAITMILTKIIYNKKMKAKYKNPNKNSKINILRETENEIPNNPNGFNKNSHE